MLSNCAPFSRAVADASKGASKHTLRGIVTAISGEQVVFNLDGVDIQSVTDWAGNSHKASGKNIKEIVSVYFSLFPSLRPATLELVFVIGDQTHSSTVNLINLNPELIATAAKRLLRKFNGRSS